MDSATHCIERNVTTTIRSPLAGVVAVISYTFEEIPRRMPRSADVHQASAF